MPDGSTTFHDLIRGEVTFDHVNVPDFVLARADGSPLYTLAVAVDDVLMKITHILRGEDLLSSTPRQIAVYRAMGVADEDLPLFAHQPFVMGEGNAKLSKRYAASSIGYYRNAGFVPEAVCNYLGLLGWSPGDDREDFTLQEMTEAFTLGRVNRHPARFDLHKLESINGDKIRALDPEELVARILPFLQSAGLVSHEPTDDELRVVAGGAPLIQERMVHLTEAVDMLGFLLVDDEHFTVDDEAASRSLTEEQVPVLEAAHAALAEVTTWETAPIEAALRTALVDSLGIKPKHAFGPVRAAVTGRRVSPPLFESLELLGRDRTLRRLSDGLAAARG
jgi:glutamyl-tRNA synthetase